MALNRRVPYGHVLTDDSLSAAEQAANDAAGDATTGGTRANAAADRIENLEDDAYKHAQSTGPFVSVVDGQPYPKGAKGYVNDARVQAERAEVAAENAAEEAADRVAALTLANVIRSETARAGAEDARDASKGHMQAAAASEAISEAAASTLAVTVPGIAGHVAGIAGLPVATGSGDVYFVREEGNLYVDTGQWEYAGNLGRASASSVAAAAGRYGGPGAVLHIAEAGRGGEFDWQASGTPDGGITIPAANGVWKRRIEGRLGYLEWFVGDDKSNKTANLNALVAINAAGLEAKVKGEVGIAVGSTTTISNAGPLRISGSNRHRDKLILETKHSTAEGNFKYGYFGGSHDIALENLTLTTRSYEDGIRNEIASEYKFCTIYRPNNIRVSLKGCDVRGSISFIFQHNQYGVPSTPQEIEELVVERLEVSGCRIDHVSKLFLFRTCYCLSAEIHSNRITNLQGNLLQSALGTDFEDGNPIQTRNGAYKFYDNHVENDTVFDVVDWYHTPLVVVCDRVYYYNNTIKNLLNKDQTERADTTTAYGAETYALYASANKIYFYDNYCRNILGRKRGIRNDNTFVRFKASHEVYMTDNELEIDRQALVDVGVLDTVSADLSTVDPDVFNYAIFGYSRSNATVANIPANVFVYERNRLKVPLVNTASHAPKGVVSICDNTFEVEYLGLHNAGDPRHILLATHRYGTTNPLSGRRADFNDNTIIIHEVEDPARPVLVWGEQEPVYSSLDKTHYAEYFAYRNNTFVGEGLTVEMGLARAPRLDYGGNRAVGAGMTLRLDSALESLAPYEVFGRLRSSVTLESPADDLLLIRPKIHGEAVVEIEDNAQGAFVVMRTVLTDWSPNAAVADTDPYLMTFEVEYETAAGVPGRAQFNLAQTVANRLRYVDTTGALVTNFNPTSDSDAGPFFVADKHGGSVVGFEMERFVGRTMEFRLTGLAGLQRLRITARVWTQPVDAGTFYSPWLSPSPAPRRAAAQADSAAADVAGVVSDFNALLAKLRAANVIAS